jgi:O-antigen/teichoic acid export membrane protein
MIDLREQFRLKEFRDSFLLYASFIGNIILGWLIAKINTQYLSIEAFAQYSFFIIVIFFSRVFYSGGYYESASRLLAACDDRRDQQQVIFIVFKIAFFAGIASIAFNLILADVFDNIFQVKISRLIFNFSFMAGLVVIYSAFPLIFRGNGNIQALSITTILPRIIYLIILFGLVYFSELTLYSTIVGYGFGLLLTIIFGISVLRFVFTAHNSDFTLIKQENARYGKHIYVSNIFNEIIFHSDKILISYFLIQNELAYYNLAYMLTFPIAHFSTALATSHFKQFAIKKRIPRNVILLNLAFVSVSVLVLVLVRKPLITILFSDQYLPVIEVLPYLAIAFGLSGISKPYTYFLMANQKGKIVRNISIIVPTIQVTLNILLIPVHGMLGAAFTAVGIYLLDVVVFYIWYRRIS